MNLASQMCIRRIVVEEQFHVMDFDFEEIVRADLRRREDEKAEIFWLTDELLKRVFG